MVVLAPQQFRAVIFDLDGVVTRTAAVHALAWKKLFESYLGQPFSDADYRQYVDGKPRYEGVRDFLSHKEVRLSWGDPSDSSDMETICGLGNLKNEFFVSHIQDEGVEIYPASVDLIYSLRSLGIKVGVVTSSRNCSQVLAATGLEDVFEVQIDGIIAAQEGLRGKPEADTFIRAANLLNVPVSQAVVIEDAVSGVAAGRLGGFGLVVGVDRAQQAQALLDGGADLVVQDLAELAVPKPSAMTLVDRLKGQRLALFLDYDGTLTPLVDRPEAARLSESMLETLAKAADKHALAVVTGRDRADLERVSGLSGVIIAGSHGFEIAGPNGFHYEYPKAHLSAASLAQAADALQNRLLAIEGAWVERKRYALAVHYRQVAEEEILLVDAIVEQVACAHPDLKRAGGKKIFELKPDQDWDKGRAVLWLIDRLELSDRTWIYIGDDVTDEDAFRALRGAGVGICVQKTLRLTAAEYVLDDVNEVESFLRALT